MRSGGVGLAVIESRGLDVVAQLGRDLGRHDVAEDYPYLTADDIKACLAYAAAQADRAIVVAS